MLTYSFSDTGSESLYIYLYKCIKKDIFSGQLSSGTRLPSKRSLAKNLGISSITVENAYSLLLSEGYLYSLPRKGYYVADISTLPSDMDPDFSDTGFSGYHKSTDSADNILADLSSNRTVSDNFPFSVWARLLRETITYRQEELMTPAPTAGIPELRNAIASHLKQFRNISINPDRIIIGSGTEYLYSLLIQLLGHEKIYAVETPGYKKIAQVYKSNNVECRFISFSKSGLSIEDLEGSGADIVHISPSHHYPTGIVTPVSKRYEMLGWASKSEDRYIIEDDYDSEFRLTGHPVPTLQSIDLSEKVIYMNTFTKSLASTIRISYMILPAHLMKKFNEKLGFYSCTVSNFEQYTLARFMKEGFFEKHIVRMRKFYKELRDELLSGIKNSPLASCSFVSEEESGLHFLLELHTGMSDEDLVKHMSSKGIRISTLSQYYHREEDIVDSHTFIINYSGLRPDMIPEIISSIYSCIGQVNQLKSSGDILKPDI